MWNKIFPVALVERAKIRLKCCEGVYVLLIGKYNVDLFQYVLLDEICP